MFDETSETPSAENSMPKSPTEDIFAGTDSAEAGQPARPAVFEPMKPSLTEMAMDQIPANDNKKYLVLSGLIIVVILVGAGAWFGYQSLKNSLEIKHGLVAPITADINQVDELAPTSTASQPGTASLASAATSSLPSDTLAAAVTSTPEEAASSSLSSSTSSEVSQASSTVDSDQDGLTDVEEAKWGTNPLKADTDGDGYTDGAEINSGYNPLGAGKLTAEQLKLRLEEQLNK